MESLTQRTRPNLFRWPRALDSQERASLSMEAKDCIPQEGTKLAIRYTLRPEVRASCQCTAGNGLEKCKNRFSVSCARYSADCVIYQLQTLNHERGKGGRVMGGK